MPTNKKTAAPQSERVANVIHIRSRAEYRSQPEPTLRSDNLRPVAACPYCGERRDRQECAELWQAKHVLPACAVGPRNDAPRAEKMAFYAAHKPDLYASFNHESALVATFRRWSWRIGIGLYAFAVVVAMYFAFQLGRGVL
jgi:hypothetical protein